MSTTDPYLPPETSIRYKQKTDPQYIYNTHFLKCLQSIGTIDFEENLEGLLRIIPTITYNKILARRDEWNPIVSDFEYRWAGPIPLGSEEKPLMQKINKYSSDRYPVPYIKDEDGVKVIDWNDPNIISPRIVENEVPDYMGLLRIIAAETENAGLSWNVEMHTYDNGDVKKSKKKRNRLLTKETDTGKKLPVIPLGYDTKVISTIPDSDVVITNWHGTQFYQGYGYAPVFFNLINERTNNENGTIVGIGGAPGDGKTYFGMRMGEILNRVRPKRKFNPYVQIPFTQEHFLWLLSDDTPLQLGDVIILDEAHFAAGARSWFKEDQKELVDLIASARNMGFIVILVVLHMSMLDKMLRQFTMAFYVHMEKAGKATAYQTFTPRFNHDMRKKRIGPVTLKLPDISKCLHNKCLHCIHLNPKTKKISACYSSRAIYERRKRHFQNLKIEASLKRREHKQRMQITDKEKLAILHNNRTEFKYTSHGNIENTVIQQILYRELEIEVGKTKSRELAKRYLLEYPGTQTIP